MMTPEADISSDEGLTTALSAFLAQLHSGFDEGDTASSAAPVADLSAKAAGVVRPQRSSSAGGALPHRTPGATQQATKAAFSPLRPMTSAGGGQAGRVPPVDAWGAAAVLAGQRESIAKAPAPRVVEPPEKIALDASCRPAPSGKAPIVRKPAGPTKVAAPVKATSTPQSQAGTKPPAVGKGRPAVSAPPGMSTSAPAAKAAPATGEVGAAGEAAPKLEKLRAIRPQVRIDLAKLAQLRSLPGKAQAMAVKVRAGANRERLIGAAAGVVLVSSLGFTLSWGIGESGTISQKSAQLVAAQSSLSSTAAQLAQAQHRITTQLHNLAALNGSDLHWKVQSAHLQAQLAQTQAQLTQAQQRVGTVQTQLNQAQGQLGNTQHSLLTLTQAHASQCQQAAVLAQNSVSVNNSVVLTETQYLAALRAHDRSAMTQYLNDMNALQGQASSIGTQLSSTMNACLRG
ncbi:MAG TPA: hypothetical protein VFN61_05080 [Acidimicrobiales bacterium]|nr:hypothetical protein [Acidimicrobiales bacterium]